MTDIRLQRLADLLVNYCTKVRPGDWVGILGDAVVLPALREVYSAVIKAGGNPALMMSDEQTQRTFLREANDNQLDWLNPALTLYYEQADVYIRVGGGPNTRAMTNVDPKRIRRRSVAEGHWLDTRLSRAAREEFRWVGTWYPCEASAQEANLSLEEYENFVYSATFCDLFNPVQEWEKLAAMQQEKVNWLQGKKHVKVTGPNVDLELSIAGRTFINGEATNNMPSGEIFTGPVEDSVNGWIRYSYPAIVSGRAVSGIELRFVNGKVVEAHAEQNEDLLLSQLDIDAGARYLGEFAIGTNYGINRFTGNILFDEKIGGTIHLAVGRGYEESGSKNSSAIHWDMICDMRQDSEIYVDGDLFYKNGEFLI